MELKMLKDKIFGILITYNPNFEQLKKNVEIIAKQVDKLIIFDNNSTNSDFLNVFENNNVVEIILSRENVGLGKAYNTVIQKYHHDYKYFVTFDQDTEIPQNALNILLSILEKEDGIGVIGPTFSRKPSQILEGHITFKTVIIQSCAVFRTCLYVSVGKFNEEYFIDSVDFEYCLRVLNSGKKVALYTGVNINHQLGSEEQFLGLKYVSHNNLRNYYISKNHLSLTRTFWKNFPIFIFKKNIFYLIHISKIVFIERDLEKLKYIYYGLCGKKIIG